MTESTAITVNDSTIDSWADDPLGLVALHLKQKLIPVEGEGGVIFPPTYADIGYSVDTLSDGTKVAQVDSVGSQANRMEPLFKSEPLSELVPQITIRLSEEKTLSLLDVGHRLGDASVRSTTGLKDEVKKALDAFQRGDASEIAKLAPTTLVFGAWDSRGEGAKLPRLVQSVIRAWDVEVLHRAAQYAPPVDYAALEVFDEDAKEKAEGNVKDPLAKRGFVHIPAVWRDDARKERHLGGIVAKGGIWRDVTVNLVALRALRGKDEQTLRRYVLGLTLVAAVEPQDGFLRQGCLLTPDPDMQAVWKLVHRDGRRSEVALDGKILLDYAKSRAKVFVVGKSREFGFSKELAVEDSKEDKKKRGGKNAQKKPAATGG